MQQPVPFRIAALAERKQFYAKEFSLQKVKDWFQQHHGRLPQLCAIDAGTESGLLLKKQWKGSLFYFPFAEILQKIKKYVPEDIYYDRNFYADPAQVLKTLRFNHWKEQELVFDLDVDNLVCSHRSLGYVCRSCLRHVYKSSLALQKDLHHRGFRETTIVYSGRGFHVHVLDRKAYLLTIAERTALSKKFSHHPIDPWVSRGYINLIRMPYTLHGLVSRKTMPLRKSFKKKKTLPLFLGF